MHEVIIWATFAGAWLLVAGPLYQGSVELEELEIDHEAIEGIKASAVRRSDNRPSAWWWLLPPVMYVLHRRANKAFWQSTFAMLTETQRAQLTSYRSKATGWFTVAAGATLLAAGETWQIIADHDWSVWLFWLLVVVMLAGCVLNTAVRMINREQDRRPDSAETAAAAEPR